MVSFIVRMRFAPEDHMQVREMLRELAVASRNEPGCVSYVPHFLEDDADTILIYEQYRDQAAVKFHQNSAHFKRYAVGGLYQLMRERSLENLTDIL